MKQAFLSLILVLAVGNLLAQPVGKSAYGALIQAAETSLENQDYYNALVKYEEAYDDKKDKDLLPLIAAMKFKIRDYFGAARDYTTALRSDKKGRLESVRYEYGRALKMTAKYEEALEQFQLFLATNPGDSLTTLTQNEITGVEMAMSYEDDQVERYQPNRLSRKVNGTFSEYAATFGRDSSLYYATFDADDVIILETGGEEEEGDKGEEKSKFAKIYRTTADKKDWQDPAELDIKINRPGFHTSNPSFSKDGRRMYFTRAKLQGNVVKESKIFYSEGSDTEWGAPNECVGINGDWVARHPAVGELFGREVIFFIANIEGGYGGDDIYYATYRGEGVYADPVNLGPTVNSPGNEMTPHYIDGILYFSSDGHPGFGGQDIFFTVWDGTRWSQPSNIGGRYNTAQDEQYFSLDKDGYNGFFTSNRIGTGARSVEARTCCDDIYGFELERIQASLVVGLFAAGDKQPLPGGTVSLKNVVLNTNTSQVQPEVNRFDFPLDLEMSYEIQATREGYYPASAEVSTLDLEKTEEFVRRLYLEKIPPPTEVVVTDTITVYDTVTIEKAFVLENILYAFNDDKILPEAEPDLQILLDLLNDNPDLVIELSSHTDYRGTNAYNNSLSQRRANSAKRWLTQRKVSSRRVVAKGYGKGLPQTLSKRIADRHEFMAEGDVLDKPYIDSLASEEEMEVAHQINRRTEFKILEGPTFISIPRQEYRQRTILVPPPDRKTEIKNNDAAAKIEIDKRSSLYGQDDIEGLPILVFKERYVDFGMVKQGDKREHVYEVTNKGTAEAKIAVISACDCTEATEEKKRIQPGETITINVIFDSSEKEELEVITMDMFLENKDKEGNPIIERFEYRFDIEK